MIESVNSRVVDVEAAVSDINRSPVGADTLFNGEGHFTDVGADADGTEDLSLFFEQILEAAFVDAVDGQRHRQIFHRPMVAQAQLVAKSLAVERVADAVQAGFIDQGRSGQRINSIEGHFAGALGASHTDFKDDLALRCQTVIQTSVDCGDVVVAVLESDGADHTCEQAAVIAAVCRAADQQTDVL